MLGVMWTTIHQYMCMCVNLCYNSWMYMYSIFQLTLSSSAMIRCENGKKTYQLTLNHSYCHASTYSYTCTHTWTTMHTYCHTPMHSYCHTFMYPYWHTCTCTLYIYALTLIYMYMYQYWYTHALILPYIHAPILPFIHVWCTHTPIPVHHHPMLSPALVTS